MRDYPARKCVRLKDYDYGQNGAYFVTFCVQERRKLLGRIVGSGFHARPFVELTEIGVETQKSIEYIQTNSKGVEIQKYAIMPNHVHMIIFLSGFGTGNAVGHGSPTLQSLVGRIKSYTTKRWNEMCCAKQASLWQRSFYEHIIRNESEYQTIRQYIDDNPAKWLEDKYYM